MKTSRVRNTLLAVRIGTGGALLTSTVALAAPRTVCFKMKIRDDRFACPDVGTTGAKRACNKTGLYSYYVGGRYELWDKDRGSSANDEFIGSWTLGGEGTRCVTFEWENASYSKGEANPDVYVRLTHKNRAVNSLHVQVEAVGNNRNSLSNTTWRGNNDRYVARNCTSGGACTIYPGRFLVPTNDPSSNRGQRFMMLDSAERVLTMYGPDMEAKTIDARYPATNCITGFAFSREEFCLPAGLGAEGDRVTHEMGHVSQMHMFHQDTLRNACDGPWGMNSFETESCAGQEGWAAYVGAVAWYNPYNNNTVPYFLGANLEAASLHHSTCNQNITSPKQVAKAFWDYNDVHNEAASGNATAADTTSKSTTWMNRQWDEFGDGTGNHQDMESGSDGVNMWDYRFHAISSGSWATLLHHNCLESQATD